MSNIKTGRVILLILYGIAIVSPVIALDWRQDSVIVNLGLSAGLMAFVILVFQVLLTCRWKWLDRIFAIDRITNFHRRMGIIVACLLIGHVSLIITGTKSLSLLSMGTPWQVNLGKAALILLWLTVMLALTFEAFGLDYNIWRVSHKSALAIVALGFYHSWFIGDDIRDTHLWIYWWALPAAAAAAAGYRNIFIPLFGRKLYHVKSILHQTHNTYTLTLTPEKKPIALHKPGQFMFLKLIRSGRKSEIHPFTIASSPTGVPVLQATIKQSGNFTDTIDQTKTSDTARVEGPYGHFSVLNYPAGPVLLIAGGVGITPIMSTIRYLRDTSDTREVILLYGNRTSGDVIFEDELKKLPANFRVFHILSQADNAWKGLKGYITKELIAEYARPMLDRAEIFLCGPPAMMDKIIMSLTELNIPRHRIHFERFTL